MAPVGFSTSCLYKSGLSLIEMVRLYDTLGNDAIELAFGEPQKLEEANISFELIKLVKSKKYVSIHAPFREVIYPHHANAGKIIDKLKYICSVLSIQGIVLHPHKVNDFSALEKMDIPFVIENLHKSEEQRFGSHPEHFEKLKKDYSFNFVLDIQHAYEWDPTMSFAKEMISAMGNRLKHFHVSGENKTYGHVPTYESNNKTAISSFLKSGLPQPKILEGILENNIAHKVKRELEFIRQYEK